MDLDLDLDFSAVSWIWILTVVNMVCGDMDLDLDCSALPGSGSLLKDGGMDGEELGPRPPRCRIGFKDGWHAQLKLLVQTSKDQGRL